jgi:hypothetical protein
MRFLRFPAALLIILLVPLFAGQRRENREERQLREAVEHGKIDDARRLLAAGAHATSRRSIPV